MSLTIKSLIIFLTLTNGSAAARSATMASTLLPVDLARPARKATSRSCSGLDASLRSCASAAPRLESCSSWGRCFSPEPFTEPLEMMSVAFAMASSSSWRSFCRASKSAVFTLQSACVSMRYLLSSSLSAVVIFSSPSVSASSASFSARVSVFLLISCSAFSMLSASCWRICSNACCAVFSSISISYFFWPNSPFSFSSMSTTPCDWNSYA
mmetsp:Transcript_11807/g.32885  ORF Transcript_11807/g.32885 Transcript_11807/m.32885 type:complete len:211 (+) Transcript_11807:937-1569(+)